MTEDRPAGIVLRDLVLELASLQGELLEVGEDPTSSRRGQLLRREERILERLRSLGPDRPG